LGQNRACERKRRLVWAQSLGPRSMLYALQRWTSDQIRCDRSYLPGFCLFYSSRVIWKTDIFTGISTAIINYCSVIPDTKRHGFFFKKKSKYRWSRLQHNSTPRVFSHGIANLMQFEMSSVNMSEKAVLRANITST
jgi:hypothetical protein